MTKRPKLYPGHQHQWTDADGLTSWNEHEGWQFVGILAEDGIIPPIDGSTVQVERTKPGMVRCTVCGFTAPRNAAGLDGRMPQEPYHPPRPARCPICSPDQETRADA